MIYIPTSWGSALGAVRANIKGILLRVQWVVIVMRVPFGIAERVISRKHAPNSLIQLKAFRLAFAYVVFG